MLLGEMLDLGLRKGKYKTGLEHHIRLESKDELKK